MARHDGGDLFDLAGRLAGEVGAPITIEDPQTVVLAYSVGSQDVDEARVGTILGRRIPDRYRTALAEAGVFDRLASSDEVIVVELDRLRMVPRAVVAVRDRDGRLLGSIWAAVSEPPSPGQVDALRAAVPAVARRLRRARYAAEPDRQVRAELLEDLLTGDARAGSLVPMLAMRGPWRVAVVRGGTESGPRQIHAALDAHLAAMAPSALCAALGRDVYALLSAPDAMRLLNDFVLRYERRDHVAVGIGSLAEHAEQLSASRAAAEDVVESLWRRGRTGTVATLEAAFADVLVDRVAPFLAAHRGASPLTRLIDHDEQHDSGLVDVVRAVLECQDIAGAAQALHVHPNTVRNRLRRAAERCDVRLDDPDTRLALSIALRLHDRDRRSDAP